jgi:hypothetical protein
MFSNVSLSPFFPLKGLFPVNIRNTMTPSAQRSEAKQASSPLRTSGERNSAVPTKSHRDDCWTGEAEEFYTWEEEEEIEGWLLESMEEGEWR